MNRLRPGTRRCGGAEPQSLVSVSNIRGLNPKSLLSAYDVKAYVLLTAIIPSDPHLTLSQAVPLVLLKREG